MRVAYAWKSVLALPAILLGNNGHIRAQLLINDTQTPAELVQNVLVGTGIQATNITFNGLPGLNVNQQVAAFDATATVLGMGSGILLATGGAAMAIGPNNSPFNSEPPFNTGNSDPDLSLIADLPLMFDAAVLEFDLVPENDSIRFDFIFASDEYLEFVGGYNDAFGFFLSGPGLSGPYSGGAINLAVVPGTGDPIRVNSVNSTSNPDLFLDNGDGITAPYNTDPQYVQYDGYTVRLTAGLRVQCNATYHIKLAIADAVDVAVDSGIFLEASSFSSPAKQPIAVALSSPDGPWIEGCGVAVITLTRPDTTGAFPVSLNVSGTTTNGVDHATVPTTLTIPAGATSVTYALPALADGFADSGETLIVTVTYSLGCNEEVIAADTIYMEEPVAISATDETVNLLCDPDSTWVEALVSGGSGTLTFNWSTGASTSAIHVPGGLDQLYSVTITDACGQEATALVTVDDGCGLIIPNVITPNGDGINDAFHIDGITSYQNQLRIYNRWGQIVHEALNYKNTWYGGDVPDGTYYYELIVEGLDTMFTGILTVLGSH